MWHGVCAIAHVASLSGNPVRWQGTLILGVGPVALVAGWLGPRRETDGVPEPVGLVRGGLFAVGITYGVLFCVVPMVMTALSPNDGQAAGLSGERYLDRFGTNLRDISEEEYQLRQLDTQRQTTAALVGTAWCAVVTSYFPPRRKDQRSESPADTPPAPSPTG